MNAKQRRLVRRAEDLARAADTAGLMGDDESTIPRPARHVLALLRRAPGCRRPLGWSVPPPPHHRLARAPMGFPGGIRDPRAYGLRCHECGRPAHGIEHNGPPVCRLHNTDIPF